MGLFDFLKRSAPRQPTASEEEGPSLHYALAHYALRQFALDDPLQYLAVLASPDAQPFIGEVLESVAAQFQRTPEFSPEDVIVHPVRVNNYPCAIIEMPEPREVAEAYFTALIAPIDVADQKWSNPEEAPARYFTLEKGFSLDGSPRTVFAEWDNSGHTNYGDGLEPTVEAFARAIGEHLTS